MKEEFKNQEDLKGIVKDRYGKIVEQSSGSCCCSCGCEPSEGTYTVFSEDYKTLEGYNSDADLSLGCGIPVKYANINKGVTVLDLGSGAGNDCFVARAMTGETGKVIGIDFTQQMIDKARANAEKLGYTNIKFILGDIENMPVVDESIDVVISNCVLNLVPDKQKAFSEIHRVLKTGGHFCISDVVIEGIMPEELKTSAEMYAGCVAGALQKEEYLNIIRQHGFKNLDVVTQKKIEIPIYLLAKHGVDTSNLHNTNFGIYSITVVANK